MITSIFNKSKPINFVIVFFITLLAFIVSISKEVNQFITLDFVVKQLVVFSTVYFSVLLLNFIVSKNNLTNNNNYEILLFSLFLLLMTQTVSKPYIIASNFFVLLGLRRLVSIRSQKHLKKKLFDAAFWIAIAALFYFWAILFFALIIVSLVLYTDSNIRHWIIPFLSLLTVLLISSSFSFVFYGDLFDVYMPLPSISYNFNTYNTLTFIIAITILFSFGVWASFFYLKSIKKKKKAFRASFKTIVFMVIVAFIIVLLAPKKNGSEFLFLLAPLSIVITNYIELIQEKWFKEVFLSILIIAPILLLFF